VNRRSLLKLLPAAAVATIVAPRSPPEAKAEPGTRRSIGLNITGMSYWATELPFSNLSFNASRWRVQIDGAAFTWDTPLPPMTDDGYPIEIPTAASIDSFLIHTSRRENLSEELSVHYDGRGTLAYFGGAELEARTPGRDEVRNLRKGDAFTARLLATDPRDPLRNIRVFERGTEPTGTFRRPFLHRLRGMSTLRFMDWMATNNSKVRQWQDRPKAGTFGRSDDGVPLEHMIELCNIAGTDPWFNMPHLADDDYVRRFAEQVKSSIRPSLNIYVEYSNEVWNSLFGQARYASEQGLAAGLSDNPYEAQLRFYAQRTTEVLAIWEDVFADSRHRIMGVYAAQSANDWTSATILSWRGVKDHCDVLAIAPYFGGSLGTPERANEVAEWSLDRLFSELRTEIESDNLFAIERQSQLARRHGVKLVAYEGGQHLVGHGGAENNARLTELFVAANRDRRMGELYRRHLNVWWAAGGDLYALFSSMSEPSKWGSWGLLEFEGSNNHKWDAIQKVLQA
jgi:hypothetical protein